jgi:hypothetical protein
MKNTSERRVAVTTAGLATTALMLSGLMLSGCGAAMDDDQEFLDDTEAVEELGEELSESSCASATADATFTGKIDPAHVSPRSYNTCFKGYVVDINNYAAAYTGVGGGGCPSATLQVSYGDTPLTQANCATTLIRSIYYEKRNNNWVAVSESSTTGHWLLGQCLLGTGYTGMVAGRDYRVATTARDANNNTRKVKIQSFKPVICH